MRFSFQERVEIFFSGTDRDFLPGKGLRFSFRKRIEIFFQERVEIFFQQRVEIFFSGKSCDFLFRKGWCFPIPFQGRIEKVIIKKYGEMVTRISVEAEKYKESMSAFSRRRDFRSRFRDITRQPAEETNQ